MKKLFTIVTIAVVSLNFVSCRQDEESVDFNNNTPKENMNFGKTTDSIKSDTIKVTVTNVLESDPPHKDHTPW